MASDKVNAQRQIEAAQESAKALTEMTALLATVRADLTALHEKVDKLLGGEQDAAPVATKPTTRKTADQPT